MKRLFGMVALCALAGCTYNAVVDVSPALGVYSNHDTKLQGRWALFVDSDRLDDAGEVVGIGCSAHNYPLEMESQFRASTVATIENLVDAVQLVDSPLNGAALASGGYAGQISIKTEDLDASFQAISGFWSVQSIGAGSYVLGLEGEVELTVSMLVDGHEGRLLGTTVSEDGKSRFSGDCSKGGQAVGKAAEESLERTLNVVGERLVNSRRVREYAALSG